MVVGVKSSEILNPAGIEVSIGCSTRWTDCAPDMWQYAEPLPCCGLLCISLKSWPGVQAGSVGLGASGCNLAQ